MGLYAGVQGLGGWDPNADAHVCTMGTADDPTQEPLSSTRRPKRPSSVHEKCRPGNQETCARLAHEARLIPPRESGPRQHPVAFQEKAAGHLLNVVRIEDSRSESSQASRIPSKGGVGRTPGKVGCTQFAAIGKQIPGSAGG